jgi:hypothetical protein
MDVSGQLHAQASLPQGRNPCYPLERKLIGPQSQSGRGGAENSNKSRSLNGIYSDVTYIFFNDELFLKKSVKLRMSFT